jgi:hypothetical protein
MSSLCVPFFTSPKPMRARAAEFKINQRYILNFHTYCEIFTKKKWVKGDQIHAQKCVRLGDFLPESHTVSTGTTHGSGRWFATANQYISQCTSTCESLVSNRGVRQKTDRNCWQRIPTYRGARETRPRHSVHQP